MSASTAQHLPEAVLRPVRGHHAFEACVEQLATLIRLGVYPRGSTFPPERELADRLAVSRATAPVGHEAQRVVLECVDLDGFAATRRDDPVTDLRVHPRELIALRALMQETVFGIDADAEARALQVMLDDVA